MKYVYVERSTALNICYNASLFFVHNIAKAEVCNLCGRYVRLPLTKASASQTWSRLLRTTTKDTVFPTVLATVVLHEKHIKLESLLLRIMVLESDIDHDSQLRSSSCGSGLVFVGGTTSRN
jgi:hypothetical protein